MKQHRYALFGTVAAVALGSTTGADAQDNTNARPSEGSTIADVVVTAQRREESVNDVPISITVATAEDLEQAGVTKLEDIGQLSPSTQVSSLGIYTQPSIRGVTSSLAGGAFENNVSVYVDGVYYPITRALNLELANIAQVQVLKGPQGTLFGRNSTGGALLVNTLDPNMTEQVGRIGGSFFSFNDRRAQLYFSTPVTDTLAWNISGYLRQSDGYIRDVSGIDMAPIDNSSISTKLRWEPTSRFALQFKYDHTEVSDARGVANTSEPGRDPISGFPLHRNLAARSGGDYVETRDNRTSHTIRPVVESEIDTALIDMQYDLGWSQLNGLVSYQNEKDVIQQDRDYVSRRTAGSQTQSNDDTDISTADFNFTSANPGPVQYVVGVYYYHSEQYVPAYLLNDDRSLTIRQVYSMDTEAISAFADLTWEVVPKLFLTGGVRVNHEERNALVTNPAGVVINSPTINPAFVQKAEFEDATPRVVVRYELDDASNVYASVTRGSRSGTLSISSPFNLIKPEEITAYEIGYKTLQDRFRFDSSVFYYDFTNMQVSGSVIDPATGLPLPLTTNAESAEIYGAEFQINAEVVEDFNVGLGVAYTHAEYETFTGASVNGIQGLNAPVTTGAGLNASSCFNPRPPPATTTCVQDFSGRQMLRAPEWTANLSADYTMHSGIGEWVLSGNVSYSGDDVPSRGDLHPLTGAYRYGAEAYTVVNARLAWNPYETVDFTVALVGQNITDERHYMYRAGAPNGDFFVLATPAAYGVSVDYRF